MLRVLGELNEGNRDVTFEGASVAWARIGTLPSGFRVDRPSIRSGKKLALTFDDGPDPTWTPQILAILAKYGIRATFFVVGDQAERYPEIIRAEFASGHLLGNHTYLHPDLDQISDMRLKWEINATQRVIQALTEHSVMLFRSPYDAHAEPTLPTELHELHQATQMGYLITGTDIDSEDYEIPANDRIAQNVLTKLQSGDAHVIVFHDAGGDRHKTVEALDQLIPQLLVQGYQFVGIDDLLGVKKSELMPPISDAEQFLAFARRIVVWLRVWGGDLLLGLFFSTTAMSVARLLFLALLIVRGKLNANRRQETCFTPNARVLIPAHNEAKVIAQTLQAVLKSDYPRLCVTVIDDGSTDDTARIVREYANADARLSLITQSDCSGKAAALNRGFNETHDDYVITLDADTVVFPHTVRELMEPFFDPTVDAVCGNVQVGNVRNTLTKFQHVEYVTSQNYERRAFDAVNCISVVPGATGAWKRRIVLEVGGYSGETLAEDTDLTLTLLGCGGRIVYAPLAQSVTEAPEKVAALFRQRYRWSFGTLQCLWKHRKRWGRGSLGWITLTNILVFQFLFPAIAPLGDALLIKCLVRRELVPVAIAYLIFLALDFISPIIAFRLDRQNLGHASVVIIQRFFYRQFMYVVTFAALFGALRGKRYGWDKLDRTGAGLSSAWSRRCPPESRTPTSTKKVVPTRIRANFLCCILCLIVFVGFGTPATAGSSDTTSANTDATETVAISTGIGVTNPYSAYGYFSALFAPPAGLDQTGFRLRVGTVDGQFAYSDQDSGSRIYGLGLGASLLAGYSFNQGVTSLLLMAGSDVENIHLSAPDPSNPAQSTAIGAQVLTELYSTPTKDTKIDLEGEYSTAFKSYFVRFDPAYAAFGNGIFVGPKLMFLGDEHYQQWRLGVSVSGFKVGRMDLGFNVGYLRDRDQGAGAFAGLDLYLQY